MLRGMFRENTGRLLYVFALLGTGAACDGTTDANMSPERMIVGGEARAGRHLIADFGCGVCHMVPGVRGADGTVGPPLIAFGRRGYIAGVVPNRPELLVSWLVNPPGIAPDTAMPDLGIDETEARHIAAYLYTLR